MPWRQQNSQGDVLADTGEPGEESGLEAPIVPEPGLQLSAETRFADVPLPAGVKENLDRTYVYESKNLQIGRMVYTIRASVNELAQFYIRECPVAGWKLESSMQAEGAELAFEKPGKRLEVTIRDVGITRGGSLLVLHLTPLPETG